MTYNPSKHQIQDRGSIMQKSIIEREAMSKIPISGRKSIPLKEQEQMSLHHIKSSLWIFILAAIF
jgi:hypothetical protein